MFREWRAPTLLGEMERSLGGVLKGLQQTRRLQALRIVHQARGEKLH